MNVVLLALVPSILIAIAITYKTNHKNKTYIIYDQEDSEIYSVITDNTITV